MQSCEAIRHGDNATDPEKFRCAHLNMAMQFMELYIELSRQGQNLPEDYEPYNWLFEEEERNPSDYDKLRLEVDRRKKILSFITSVTEGAPGKLQVVVSSTAVTGPSNQRDVYRVDVYKTHEVSVDMINGRPDISITVGEDAKQRPTGRIGVVVEKGPRRGKKYNLRLEYRQTEFRDQPGRYPAVMFDNELAELGILDLYEDYVFYSDVVVGDDKNAIAYLKRETNTFDLSDDDDGDDDDNMSQLSTQEQ